MVVLAQAQRRWVVNGRVGEQVGHSGGSCRLVLHPPAVTNL